MDIPATIFSTALLYGSMKMNVLMFLFATLLTQVVGQSFSFSNHPNQNMILTISHLNLIQDNLKLSILRRSSLRVDSLLLH